MRAAFGLLVMVVVMAVVLSMAKKQAEQAKLAAPPTPASGQAGTAAPATNPQAIGQQVQDAVNQSAQRASDAQP